MAASLHKLLKLDGTTAVESIGGVPAGGAGTADDGDDIDFLDDLDGKTLGGSSTEVR